MIFFIGTLILVLASVGVVYKTLTGYTSLGFFSKFAILIFLLLAWFAPVWLRFLQKGPAFLSGTVYDVAYKLGYFMMGFVLILSMLIIARDLVWHILYWVSGKKTFLNPDIVQNINIANVATLILAVCISLYGVWQAHKTPIVQNLHIKDVRITSPVKFVIASDFHINRSTPKWHIQKMINAVNVQNPDYILLVGDIADDEPEKAFSKIKMLSALKAKKIYISMGNHEYYHKPYAWMIEFSKLGFEVLQNSGEHIKNSNIYVAGVPDAGSASVNYKNAFWNAKDKYKILISHAPTDFKDLDKSLLDIQFSGHTHGGQIFPFQYIIKKANDGYLSGLYEENGAKLFVMKGVGYWGPPMRILAQPDIVVLTLEPQK